MRAVLEEAELVYASDLTLVECDRSLVRLEVADRLSAIEAAERRAVLSESSRYWALLHVSEEIVDRARGRFPTSPSGRWTLFISPPLWWPPAPWWGWAY